jgi:aqualysin 1
MKWFMVGLAAALACKQIERIPQYPTLSGVGHDDVRSVRTISLGLDRIDQTSPELDGIFAHHGTGRGVTVYVFDGGVSTDDPELKGRVRIGFSSFPDDPKVCNGHGTAVSGAIAGNTLGVASEAKIVDVKMIQCEKMRGSIKTIVDATKWVIEDHENHPGPAVANWSFIADTSLRIRELDSAVMRLNAAKIAVVVSAGNVEMDACRISPANAFGAIVVGATALDKEVRPDGKTNVFDRRSSNTAFGPCIDIYAPGDSVLLPSMDRNNAPISVLWNGTSMSAGYVSGGAALYLETHPEATPRQVAKALYGAATPNAVRDAKAPFNRLLNVRNLSLFKPNP